MLNLVSSGSLASLPGGSDIGHAARDLILAQLDIIAAASGGAMHAVSAGAVDPFVARFSIFVLAIFIGYFVVWSVTPALHTPLMSVTNAISSVIVVGALLAVAVKLIPGSSGPIWAPRARLRRAHLRLDQHLWRVSGHPAHARDVPEEGRQEHRPMSADLVALLYLLAAVLFILALRGLSNPETSRRGNLFGMAGMAIAIATTLASHPPEGAGAWTLVLVGIAIGGTVGAVIARRVPMTAMPELVAAFHSLVGMAAVLVAAAALYAPAAFDIGDVGTIAKSSLVEMSLGLGIGAITFTGSVIAFLKLSGRMSGKPIILPARHVINIALALAIIVLIVWLVRARAMPLSGCSPSHPFYSACSSSSRSAEQTCRS